MIRIQTECAKEQNETKAERKNIMFLIKHLHITHGHLIKILNVVKDYRVVPKLLIL